MEANLNISSLKVGYRWKKRGAHTVAGPLDARTQPCQLISLIGPNGSGKSTLLRTLSGIQRKLDGHILLLEQEVETLSRATMAKNMSLVLTESLSGVNLTTEDVVALGRHPYTGWMGGLTAEDHKAVQDAMDAVEITGFRHRKIHELSDGEAQKVLIARAIAQDTPLMLLDEPTAHLDIANRIEIIHLLQHLTRKTQKTIIQSTHELDLALHYSDLLWVLDASGNFSSGVPEDLVFEGLIEQVFGNAKLRFDMSTGVFVATDMQRANISLSGDKTGMYWTRRALERSGFNVFTANRSPDHVEVLSDGGGRQWQLELAGHRTLHHSIAGLLTELQNMES